MFNIFIACNSSYYHNYGINCIRTIQQFAPWVKITVHIVNPCFINEILNVKYSYEYKDIKNFEARISYYQSVRFIKCSEIFKNSELVLSIDCDTLCEKEFDQNIFEHLLRKISVLKHHKKGRWMAGFVTYGDSMKFRNQIKQELLSTPVELWDIGRDQKILKKLSEEFKFNEVEVGKWMSFGKKGSVFFTLKGDQKQSDKYIKTYYELLKNGNS